MIWLALEIELHVLLYLHRYSTSIILITKRETRPGWLKTRWSDVTLTRMAHQTFLSLKGTVLY